MDFQSRRQPEADAGALAGVVAWLVSWLGTSERTQVGTCGEEILEENRKLGLGISSLQERSRAGEIT